MSWPSGPSCSGPLGGLRVLDLSRILAGPYATMLLADLGADVVKVEAPGRGDETRRWGPPFADDGTAAYFLGLNRNKRSVSLDLASADGAGIARQLARDADVVINNFMPGRMARFGLDRATLAADNPRIITCTITGFGRDNEYETRPGFDFLLQAMGGIMSVTGHPDGEPTKVGVPIADLAAGLFATVGILAALRERDATARGRDVEVSLLDAVVGLLSNQAMSWLVAGVEPGRLGNDHPSICPYESYATADEPIAIGAATDRQFAQLARALERPDLIADPRFESNAQRTDNRPALRRELESVLTAATRDHWFARLTEHGVPVAPINTIPEALADPVVADRMVAEADGVPQVRSPVRIDDRPAPVVGPPPRLGAHTEEVLRAMGMDSDSIARLRQQGTI